MGLARGLGKSVVCAIGALLLSASAASAANRFASPTGTGSACTQASPCDVTTAVNSATTGDDVTIEPGTYTSLSTTLTDLGTKVLTIHGQAGAARPVLDFAGTTVGFGLSEFGTSLSNIEVDISGPFATGIQVFGAVTVDRVIAHTLGAMSTACVVSNATATVSNSVCVADGSGPSYGAQILDSVNATFRNDTLEAPGGSGSTGGVGLQVEAFGSSHSTPTLTNVIAHGEQFDLLAQSDTSNTSSEAVITADHSNYANVQTMGVGIPTTITPAGSGTNQTAAPQFANPGMDDFHEVAGSPTIGAGFSSPANGMFDLDDNPRQVAGSTDIGAYEFIPPPSCQPATATTAFGQPTTVQLSCSDIFGAAVTYAIVAHPAHGSVSLIAGTGQATYTPAAGYSGPDSFTFDATSSNGTGAAATASITVTKPPAPSDSKPKLSPDAFVAFSGSGPSVITAAAKGAIISYTDSQAATTTFVVRQPIGKGVLSHGKCVKPKHGKRHGRSCTLYKTLGSFSHTDTAGTNRFRFTGRVKGHTLKPGKYQLVSTPSNSAGVTGASNTSNFTIKP